MQHIQLYSYSLKKKSQQEEDALDEVDAGVTGEVAQEAPGQHTLDKFHILWGSDIANVITPPRSAREVYIYKCHFPGIQSQFRRYAEQFGNMEGYSAYSRPPR